MVAPGVISRVPSTPLGFAQHEMGGEQLSAATFSAKVVVCSFAGNFACYDDD
jgi:hypothetical protein